MDVGEQERMDVEIEEAEQSGVRVQLKMKSNGGREFKQANGAGRLGSG